MVSQLRGDEPPLQLGDSGDGVRELQFRLYRLGLYRQFPDGTYDMVTENAVRELQSSYGQDNTGEVTADTWAAIVHWEQQSSLDYQYPSPMDALDQLRYDLDHPATGDGQWAWDGREWVAASGTGAEARVGDVSPDGQWRWDGRDWVAAASVPAEFSPDGAWRWDGAQWVAATAQDHVGRLSPDGYWRWDGSDWVVA